MPDNSEQFLCTCAACHTKFVTNNPTQELCFLCLNEYSDWIINLTEKTQKNEILTDYIVE